MQSFVFSALLCATAALAPSATFGQTKTIVHNHQTVNLTAEQNGRTTNMTTAEAGAIVTLRLKDNSGSTGYHWSLGIDNNTIVAPFGEKLIPGAKTDEMMVGVPGEYEYQMKITGKAGKTKIMATLTSPTGQSSVKFEHTIVVGGAKKKRKK